LALFVKLLYIILRFVGSVNYWKSEKEYQCEKRQESTVHCTSEL